MIKQNQRKFSVINVLIDAVSVSISIIITYLLSQSVQESLEDIFHKEDIVTLIIFSLIIIVTHLIFYKLFDLYSSHRTTRFYYEAVNVLKANMVSFFALELTCLIINNIYNTQIFLIILFIVNTVIIVSYRFFLRKLLRYLRKKGYNKKFIVIIGINNCTEKFIESIKANSSYGYEILGYFNDKTSQIPQYPYLGIFKAIPRYLEANSIDEAVFMINDSNEQKLLRIYSECEKAGIKTSIIPNIFNAFSSRIYVSSFGSVPVISLRKVPLDNKFNAFIKRLCDVVISIICIILFSPLNKK